MKLELNQEVFLVGIGNNARHKTPTQKATVKSIGRKWFTIDTSNYIGERERFSLEDGKCDGKGYMSEWRVYESEEEYNKSITKPKLVKQIKDKVENLSYEELEGLLHLMLKRI